MRTCTSSIAALLAGPVVLMAQSIEPVFVPPPGSNANLLGKTAGVDPSRYGILTMLEVFGTFWPKPTFDSQITSINSDGSFEVDITTGGQDLCAERVFLFAVPLNYVSPVRAQAANIPDDLYQHAIATLALDRSAPADELQVGPFTFTKKVTGLCVWGPGPNYFGAENAWVDAAGKLHLRISYTNGAWRCAEIISKDSFGYGTWSFRIESDLNPLPPPVTFSVFTYSDDPAYSHREIDYEFSNGPVVGLPNPHQFVVQPYSLGGHRFQFALPAALPAVTQEFTWVPGIVSFACFRVTPTTLAPALTYGLESAADVLFSGSLQTDIASVTVASPTNVVVTDPALRSSQAFYRARLRNYEVHGKSPPLISGTLTSDIPPAGDQKLHINLWLLDGHAPGPGQESVEVVVSDLRFTPVDPALLGPKLQLIDRPPDHVDIRLTYPGR